MWVDERSGSDYGGSIMVVTIAVIGVTVYWITKGEENKY